MNFYDIIILNQCIIVRNLTLDMNMMIILKIFFELLYSNSLDEKICLWVVINSCAFEYRLTNNHCKRNNHCWAAKTP